MNVETFEIEKEKAQEEWKAYLQAHKEKKEQVYRDLASVYGHMKEGRAVIDVVQAVRDAGLRDGGWPAVAICRADYKMAYFHRHDVGRGFFTGINERWPSGRGPMEARKEDVALPENTFRSWVKQETAWGTMIGKTIVPMIPGKFVPNGHYRNYYILWEADDWQVARPPRDPMLLRRISPTMFAVLASWDLTPVERAVLAGRIA